MRLLGREVIEREDLVIETARPWRVRLFSRPWRPWKGTVTKPDPDYYVSEWSIFAHPETVKLLSKHYYVSL